MMILFSSSRSPAQTSPGNQDGAGPSDLQSFSETLKSRLSTLSTKYVEKCFLLILLISELYIFIDTIKTLKRGAISALYSSLMGR